MSKNKNNLQTAEIADNHQVKSQEETLANPQGKTVEELKGIAQTLQVQKNQHQEKVNQAQVVMNQELTMVAKAQGALEVILQMIPKEEVEKMIQKEAENSDG